MFNHTNSQGSSNTPPRKQYYDGNGGSNVPNKYAMAMGSPNQNGKLL